MGLTVGIASPARRLEDGALRAGIGALEMAGIDTRIPDQNFLQDGIFAGDDAARADGLHALYEDSNVGAILCARGGYGAQRLLDLLDFDLIARNPKPLIGYSDITCLLVAIAERTDAPVWHGPMLYDIAKGLDERSFDRLTTVLEEPDDPFDLSEGLTILRDGQAEGPLTGGNLSVLSTLCGTAFMPDLSGEVLFLEDVDEAPYAIDRMLLQLRRAGCLDDLAGLILGDFSDIKEGDMPFGATIEEMVLHHCGHTDYPILSGFPAGHRGPNIAIRLGVPWRIKAEDGVAGLTQAS